MECGGIVVLMDGVRWNCGGDVIIVAALWWTNRASVKLCRVVVKQVVWRNCNGGSLCDY